MDIYLSWSKRLSYFVAEELTLSLSVLFGSAVRVYFSARSIDRGEPFFAKNQARLKGADRGLILVSRESLSSPWLFYEGGILLNHKSTCCEIILLDVKLSDLSGSPFSYFQCTDCSSDQFEQTFHSIRQSLRTAEIDLPSSTRTFTRAVDKLRTRILLLCRAECDFLKYRESLGQIKPSDSDAYIYNVCSALIESGITEAKMHKWFESEDVPVGVYAHHLVSLRL